MIGQKTLRPTVVSVYNYVQPMVSVTVSVMMGIGVLKWTQALAVVLVFSGVMLVTKSKSRRDIEKAKC
jgi:drug/metabolite transporter (DMT)-like permease